MNILRRIKRWYDGTPQDPYIESTRTAAFFTFRENQRHWSARAAHVLITFYLKEWKWLIPIIITSLFGVASLFFAYLKFGK